jgi:cell division protease FtsH
VTSGARGDIKQATGIARKMVCQWGMSEKMGMIEYGEGDEHVFLARDFSRMRDYSESTAQAIDAEVKSLIDEAYARATELLKASRARLDLIAKALLEWETLEGSQIRDLIEHGEMKNPPHRDPPPPPLPAEVAPQVRTEDKKSDGALPGDLAPVPA